MPGPEIAEVQTLTNLLRNGGMESWGASAPSYWTLAGAGGTAAQDTTTFYIGRASALVTRVGADVTLRQNVVGQSLSLASVQGRVYTLSARVRAGAGLRASIGLDDGVTTKYSGYASPGSDFDFVTVTLIAGLSATKLDVVLRLVDANGSARFDAVMLTEGYATPGFSPNPADGLDPQNVDPASPGAAVNFSATDRLLGRQSAGAGPGEEIPCTAAGRAVIDDPTAAAQRATLGLGDAATYNSGSGNGLDADLLDGQHGSFYRDAGNINAGTLAVARGGTGVAALPAFAAHKNGTDQTGIVSGADTKVTFGTEDFDTNANFASSTFTPAVAGKYALQASLEFYPAVDQATYLVMLFKNGSRFKDLTAPQGSGTGMLNAHGATVVDANGTTDYFEIYVSQNSGADATILGASYRTHFSGAWIAP